MQVMLWLSIVYFGLKMYINVYCEVVNVVIFKFVRCQLNVY